MQTDTTKNVNIHSNKHNSFLFAKIFFVIIFIQVVFSLLVFASDGFNLNNAIERIKKEGTITKTYEKKNKYNSALNSYNYTFQNK